MAKIVKTKKRYEVRHSTNNTLLGYRKTRSEAVKLKNQIEKRNGK